MAHEQGNKPTDDPNKYGLKFDSEKARWELLPEIQLMKIIEVFNMYLPCGTSKHDWIDLKEFNREKLLNSVITDMLQWHNCGPQYFNTDGKRRQILAHVGLKILLIIKNKSYTDEELTRTNSYIRHDLVDMKEIEKVVEVYTMGAKKYADNNWQKVGSDRYYGAFMRHFMMIRTKEAYDSELGCLHIHQALWNIMSLMYLEDKIPDEIVKAASAVNEFKIRYGDPKIALKNIKKSVKKSVKKKTTKTQSRSFGK